jgi:hypothetical protein
LLFHHSRNHLAVDMVAVLLAGLTLTVGMAVQAGVLRFLRQVARAAQGKLYFLLSKDMLAVQMLATCHDTVAVAVAARQRLVRMALHRRAATAAPGLHHPLQGRR